MWRTRVCGAVHAFVRAPHYRSIPSSGVNGTVVNRDLLMAQFRDFYRTLQHSSLVDKVHLMTERPGVEALRAADQLTCVGPTLLAMPLHGIEHRALEFVDTMRYVRGAGGPATTAAYLQEKEQCRCHSGDVVCLPRGIAVGHGPRTNAVAHQTLQELFEVKDEGGGGGAVGDAGAAAAAAALSSHFHVFTLEQEGDAPPLGDYFGFAGSNVLLAWKDEHGLLAVDQYQQHNPDDHDTQIVYLEPGCHFLSFYGVDCSTDVLVQRGYERSMDSIAAAGLNPVPVQWSEMDKLGVSMRAAVLALKFLDTSTGSMLALSKSRTGRWQHHQIKD